jgi:hypothetical protein
MKKKRKNTKGNVLFKSEGGIEKLTKFELNKFYIVMDGEVVGFEDEENPVSILSGKHVDAYRQQLVSSLREIVNMPKNHKERKEALSGLTTLMVMPFKMH